MQVYNYPARWRYVIVPHIILVVGANVQICTLRAVSDSVWDVIESSSARFSLSPFFLWATNVLTGRGSLITQISNKNPLYKIMSGTVI